MPYPQTSARMVRVTLLAFCGAVGQLVAQSRAPLLTDVALEAASIEDSSGYFVYRYLLSNSLASRSGVAGVNLDLSAPKGTGRTVLPSTGRFRNTLAGAVGPVTDHAPVGPITPDGWSGALMPNGILHWYPFQGYANEGPAVKPFSRDSAAPGGSKDGFGLRSPFLPAIRRFSAEPTLASCCEDPKPGSVEYPSPGDFRARGSTIAPTIRPEDLTIETVQSDLNRVCDSLRWISDVATCGRYRSVLLGAAAALRRGDTQTAKHSLSTFVKELEGQHGPGKPVNDNAYWLLRTNAEHLRSHL